MTIVNLVTIWCQPLATVADYKGTVVFRVIADVNTEKKMISLKQYDDILLL